MFEEFSGGYYLGRLYVEPDDRREPVLREDEFESLGEQLHGRGWTGTPLVMKVNHRHVAVRGEQGIPGETLVLPEEMLPAHEPVRRRGVLLAKAEVEERLLPFVDRYDDGEFGPQNDPFVPDAIRRRDRLN